MPPDNNVLGVYIRRFCYPQHVAETDKASAKTVLAVGFVSISGFILYKLIVGKTLKETKNNAQGCLQLIAVSIAAIIVLGIIGMILPSSCTKSNESDYIDRPYRK